MDNDLKKVLKKGLLFCIIVFIVMIVLNFLYVNVVIPKTTVYRQEQMFQEFVVNSGNKSIKYLFFGDSHTGNALNPMFLKGSYNYHSSAETYSQTYYKLRKVLEKDNVSVETIFIQIDLALFFRDLDVPQLWYYKDFMSYQEIKSIETKKTIPRIFIQSNFPVLGAGKDFFIGHRTKMFMGWVDKRINISKADRKTMAAKQVKQLFSGKKINEKGLKYFLATMELAQKHDVGVVLIRYPVTEEWANTLEKDQGINSEMYYKKIFEIIDQKNRNYKVLDYYDYFFGKPEYFENSDHLNYWGSKILTEQIKKDILENNS